MIIPLNCIQRSWPKSWVAPQKILFNLVCVSLSLSLVLFVRSLVHCVSMCGQGLCAIVSHFVDAAHYSTESAQSISWPNGCTPEGPCNQVLSAVP